MNARPRDLVVDMPRDHEAERAILGTVLAYGADALAVVTETLSAEDMYTDLHRQTLAAMVELESQGDPIDVVGLLRKLGTSVALRDAGGPHWLMRLTDAHIEAGPASLPSWCRAVQDCALRRAMIEAGQRMVHLASTESGGAGHIEVIEGELAEMAVRYDTQGKTGLRPVRQAIKASVEYVESLFDEDEADSSMLKTGFVDLDAMIGGLEPGRLYVIAARPAMGKTGLLLNIVEHISCGTQGAPTGVFSLEMSNLHLGLRLLFSRARVSASRMRATRHLSEVEWLRLIQAAGQLGAAPIYCDDPSTLSARELWSRAKAWRRRTGTDRQAMLAVDYLQLVKGFGGERGEQEIVAAVSRMLKRIAKSLSVPVLALAQVNRRVEDRADKRPTMADIRNSGQIEQDADVIMTLYRDEVYNEQTPDKGIAELAVVKNRDGEIGVVRLKWFGAHTRFENLTTDNTWS